MWAEMRARPARPASSTPSACTPSSPRPQRPRTRRRDGRVHPEAAAPELDDGHAHGREDLENVERLRLVKRPDLAFDHLVDGQRRVKHRSHKRAGLRGRAAAGWWRCCGRASCLAGAWLASAGACRAGLAAMLYAMQGDAAPCGAMACGAAQCRAAPRTAMRAHLVPDRLPLKEGAWGFARRMRQRLSARARDIRRCTAAPIWRVRPRVASVAATNRCTRMRSGAGSLARGSCCPDHRSVRGPGC